MKRLLIAAVLMLGLAAPAFAGDVYVRGYTKKDGTYVAPHYRSSPNSTTSDNWSTQGNVNPYTGQAGTRAPEPSYTPYYAPSYTPQATPTAQCNDGTYSYSQSRSGTCSYHGGVAVWY
jgi:opacity protein-like surface antigen